jgi:hypothetical protein
MGQEGDEADVWKEERQRKIDELQKQQLEHMSQYGGGQDMYGGGGGGYGQRPFSGMGPPSAMGGYSVRCKEADGRLIFRIQA